MKKLVGKTILFTLLSIILAITIVFFAMFIFTPKTLGNIFDGMGNYSTAVYFYERQYNKTDSIEDLYVLVNKLDQKEDCAKCEKFSNELVEKEDFDSFCVSKDVKGATSTKEVIYGKLAISTYYNSGIDSAIESCDKAIKETGYTESNSFRLMYFAVSGDLTNEEKAKIVNALNSIKNSLSEDEQVILIVDINYLSK